MANVTMNRLPAQLTDEEIAELEAAEKMPITFDDDSPEMTDEILKQFHKTDRVTIHLSPDSIKKIRSFGSDYARILSQLLDLALNDSELIKKEELEMIKEMEVPVMSQTINAYYTITASSEFREKERLRAKARHDEAQALYHARKERDIEIARNLLKMNMPHDQIVKATDLTLEEISKL